MSANVTYRMFKIQDPRSPGFFWFEIEGRNQETGETWTASVCDTRDEAREHIAAMRDAVKVRQSYIENGGAE